MTKVPSNLTCYVDFVAQRRSPYFDYVEHVVKYVKENSRQSYCLLNPEQLVKEISKEKQDKGLSTVSLSRTILAVLKSSNLKEGVGKDFWATKTSSHRMKYHVKTSSVIPVLKASLETPSEVENGHRK